MPKYSDNINEEPAKNAPYRSARRQVRKRYQKRVLTVRSEKRPKPDVRKIARAVLSMAMAEAEREAQAQAAEGREEGGK